MQTNDIIKMYESGHGSPYIAKQFNMTFHQILKILRDNNIPLRSAEASTRKYKYDYGFFEKIDSEEKAYWLGFILADGSISAKTKSLKISLSSKDRVHLEKFKKSLKSEYPILDEISSSGYMENARFSTIRYVGEKTVSDLIKLGITPNKTFTVTPPVVDHNYYNHLWRGIFDGDGWISRSLRKNKDGTETQVIEVGICGNINTMNAFSDLLNQLNINHHISKDKSIFRIRVCGEKRAKKLLDWLYKDASIYLTRKWKIYIEYHEWLNNKIKRDLPFGVSKNNFGGFIARLNESETKEKQKHLGTFSTLALAIQAREEALKLYE